MRTLVDLPEFWPEIYTGFRDSIDQSDDYLNIGGPINLGLPGFREYCSGYLKEWRKQKRHDGSI